MGLNAFRKTAYKKIQKKKKRRKVKRQNDNIFEIYKSNYLLLFCLREKIVGYLKTFLIDLLYIICT